MILQVVGSGILTAGVVIGILHMTMQRYIVTDRQTTLELIDALNALRETIENG